MNKMKRTTLIALVLAVQGLALGWLILRYERIVVQGVEVRFPCTAYDPYDPLRGRYLRTTVEEWTTTLPSSVTNLDYGLKNKFVVRIEPATNGLWRVAEAAFEPTKEGVWVRPKSSRMDYRLSSRERRKEEPWKDFEKRRMASGLAVAATFPDRLFVNEKLAPAAERLLSEKSRDAVAVYRVLKGRIILTDIELNGTSVQKWAREDGKEGVK